MDFPNLVKKEKALEKKKFSKNSSGKKTYIAWDENDSTTSPSSKEDKNLCLMAKDQFEVSSSRSSISMNLENYSTLLQAFLETHDEPNRLTLTNN